MFIAEVISSAYISKFHCARRLPNTNVTCKGFVYIRARRRRSNIKGLLHYRITLNAPAFYGDLQYFANWYDARYACNLAAHFAKHRRTCYLQVTKLHAAEMKKKRH